MSIDDLEARLERVSIQSESFENERDMLRGAIEAHKKRWRQLVGPDPKPSARDAALWAVIEDC